MAAQRQNYAAKVIFFCFSESVKSGRGTKIPGSEPGGVRLMWKSDNTPVLKPIISDREYLVDQHLLVGVCSEEDNEVIGSRLYLPAVWLSGRSVKLEIESQRVWFLVRYVV